MADLTEQLTNEAKSNTINAVKGISKVYGVVSNGIALILDSSEKLSEESIMKGLERKLEQTGDFNYSSSLVSIDELRKNGKVEQIEEPLLKESMKFFDKYCREFGIKYSALSVEPENSKIDKGYYIFFEGNNEKLIDHVLKKAFKDWHNSKTLEADHEQGKSIVDKPSVLSKLAFFLKKAKEVESQIEKGIESDKQQNTNKEMER